MKIERAALTFELWRPCLSIVWAVAGMGVVNIRGDVVRVTNHNFNRATTPDDKSGDSGVRDQRY